MIQRFAVAILVLALLVGLTGTRPAPVRATGFIVDADRDDANAHDASLGDCACADAVGACTLRAALEEANVCTGADTITFQTTMTITLDTTEGSLPVINESVSIDASGVWDSVSDVPGVTIDGGGGGYHGFFLSADACSIYGLHITNFGASGLYVGSGSNTIGGTGAGQRNVVSGNTMGILISGSSASANIVRNNYLGLTPAGDAASPNSTGLIISGGAMTNTIGGDQAAYANFMSGNTLGGISIENAGSDGNQIQGNVVGLAADRSTPMGNGSWGIRVYYDAANTVIGGAIGAGNVISYNTGIGVSVVGAGVGTEISYNTIGDNSGDGVSIVNTNGSAITYNVISDNDQNGVRISGATATQNAIWYNSIFANNWKGIFLENGGNSSIEAPVISHVEPAEASGTACYSCRVFIYSDNDDEGEVYHDMVWADSAGNWSYSGPLTGPNVTAIASNSMNETSEFSAPHVIMTHWIYLPLAQRSY